MSNDHIPVINFGSCGLDNEECSRDDLVAAGKLLIDAFSNFGFAYLKNTGISDSYVEEVHKVTEKFFASSEVEKIRYARMGMSKFGWIGNGKESPIADPNFPADYKEAFNADGSSFTRKNDEWPDEIAPGFSHAIMDFMERGRRLTLRILHALAIGLGLKDELFLQKCHSKMLTAECATTARTVFYPPLKNDLLPGQLRCGEHTDTTSITLLFQDRIGGLQMLRSDGQYVDATPIEETAVVNVGDVLEYWTNRDLRSTKHRVVVKETDLKNTSLRRSLIYFAIPNNDVIINKPFVYNEESRNKVTEIQQPLTTEEWLNGKIKAYWKPHLDN